MKKQVLFMLATCLQFVSFSQYESVKNKNKPNGYVGLNSQGKIDVNRLPPINTTATWNSITGKPSLFPSDWNSITGKPNTIGGYGITDGLSTSSNLDWNSVVNRPTTLSGYGITDGVSVNQLYPNPNFIQNLAWSKITNAPSIPNTSILQRVAGLDWSFNWNDNAAGNGASVQSRWNDVCFGGDKFVAVGDSGTNRIMYSYNGFNWVAIQPPSSMANAEFTSICYGNGMFVAVALSNSSGSGQRVMTSTDGINWTARTTPSLFAFRDVCYGGGKFIIVGAFASPNTQFLQSTDGINWTAINLSGNTFSYAAIAYGGGRFVAVSDNSTGGNAIIESIDFGTTWTLKTVINGGNGGQNALYSDVVYANGEFVAKSYTNNLFGWTHIVRIPTVASSYTSQFFGGYGGGNAGMCYGDGILVTVENGRTNGTAQAIYLFPMNRSVQPSSIAWTGNMTVNFTTYNSTQLYASLKWKAVCYANGMFVSVANGGNNAQARVMVSGAFNN